MTLETLIYLLIFGRISSAFVTVAMMRRVLRGMWSDAGGFKTAGQFAALLWRDTRRWLAGWRPLARLHPGDGWPDPDPGQLFTFSTALFHIKTAARVTVWDLVLLTASSAYMLGINVGGIVTICLINLLFSAVAQFAALASMAAYYYQIDKSHPVYPPRSAYSWWTAADWPPTVHLKVETDS